MVMRRNKWLSINSKGRASLPNNSKYIFFNYRENGISISIALFQMWEQLVTVHYFLSS